MLMPEFPETASYLEKEINELRLLSSRSSGRLSCVYQVSLRQSQVSLKVDERGRSESVPRGSVRSPKLLLLKVKEGGYEPRSANAF